MLEFLLGFVLGGVSATVVTCALTLYIARKDYRVSINNFLTKYYKAWQLKRLSKKNTITLKLK